MCRSLVAYRIAPPRLGVAACAAVVLALSIAALAHASAADVVKDCALDEVLQGHYTQVELRNALAGLDADADEYTNCRAVIRDAQLQGASGVPRTFPVEEGSENQTPVDARRRQGAAPTRSTAAPIPGPFGGFTGAPADPIASASIAERQAIASVHGAAVPLATARAGLPAPLIGVLGVGGLALFAGGGLALAAGIRRGRWLGSGPP